jgi:predicted DNA-binding transcriptional regulator AlpA
MNVTPSASLRPRQAAEFLGIAPATLWRWVKERKAESFPQPRKLGPRTTVFVQSELAAFRERQPSPGGAS